jgi:hypothetical protein
MTGATRPISRMCRWVPTIMDQATSVRIDLDGAHFCRQLDEKRSTVTAILRVAVVHAKCATTLPL